MLKKPLYIISRYLIFLFLDLLVQLLIAVMASNSMYPLNIIEDIIDKGLQLSDSSFFYTIYSNHSVKSIQNSLMTCHFIELSRFLSILSILWIFCSGLAKYCRYSACFIAYIKVVLDAVLLSKYSSNIFLISSINKERGDCGGIVSLNVRLVKCWIINY